MAVLTTKLLIIFFYSTLYIFIFLSKILHIFYDLKNNFIYKNYKKNHYKQNHY